MENASEILVSVMCTTFNQEKYIAKTLNSILMQKVSFRYEIIIHDDASTDNTVEIVKGYEKKYPELIRAIYQNENQYSKGIPIEFSFMFPIAKGKYYAICEGDDYWSDEYKLQKQIQYMEYHPECMLTAHAGDYCYENGVLTQNEFRPFNESRLVSMDEICSRWLFPTASIMYRASLRDKQIPFSKNAPCGDVPLVMYAGLNGTVYYFNEKMCVYRRGAKYSVTTQWKRDKKALVSVNSRFISMLDQFDEYTNKQYAEAIDLFRISKEYNNLILLKDLKSLKSDRYYDYYGKSIKRKIIVWTKIYFPKVVDILSTFVDNIQYYKCILKLKNTKRE